MYDVVVVGAGISGQICANYLAKFGKRVLLLEQNHQPGGNMSGFTRKGFYFDGGDQSFESLGIVFPILAEVAGFGPGEFIKARYRMVSADFDFFIDSPAHVEDALRTAFPDEPGIAPLFAEIREVQRFLTENYEPWDFPLLNRPNVAAARRFAKWLPKLKRWTTFRYRESALRVIRHEGLRKWLTYVGYFRMPYLFFAGFWHIWSNDYWYPAGGMQAMHDRLATAFTGRGGELLFNRLVTSVETGSNGNRATGVTTADGERFEAETVIWAADYRTLISKALGDGRFPRSLARRLLEARLTEPLVSVYLGLDMSDQELGAVLGHAQHPFYFPNYDVVFPDAASPRDVHRNMWVALNHFGEESPAGPPGKSSLTLQTFSAYRWENYWNNCSDDDRRTEGYRRLKKAVGMELVESAENLVPSLRERIEFMDVGTPLSLFRFSRNSDGSSGGWCYDDEVSPVWRLAGLNRIRTPIANLFCTGHQALWPGGVISAALSGRVTANIASGRRPLAPIGR